MNLLFLTDAFLPHAGGARVYYYNLYKQLAAETQTRITILTKKVPGWREFDRKETGLRILRCGKPLLTWKYHEMPKIVFPFYRLCGLLAKDRFDLIHFGDLYPQGVLSLWAKRMTGKPYVAYCHGEEITQTDRRRYQPRIRDVIYREASVVVAANEFARQNLLRIGISDENIRKITPGVDFTRFQPGERNLDLIEKFGLKGKTIILTVARLVPRKGHKLVLELLRELLPDYPDLVYLIVGTGPEENDLKKFVSQWNLNHAVRFAGFVPDAELAAYYNLCDLFVMPNFEERASGDIEGFGMVFLEANACGKPVLAGRSGGTAEAVIDGKTGLLVNPHDGREFGSAVRLLLDSRELQTRLGREGLNRTRSDFDWPSRRRMLDEVNRLVLRQACANAREV